MMARIRRLAAMVAASFDWMISQIENHRGLIEAAVNEMEQAKRKAEAHLGSIANQGTALRQELLRLAEQASLWQKRCLAVAALDRQRALQCLRRRRDIQKEIAQLEERERKRAALERKLGAELAAIDERLGLMHKQRKLKRALRGYADNLNDIESEESKLLTEIDLILERWDAQFKEFQALPAQQGSHLDEIEQDFTDQEDERSLRLELEHLLGGNCHE